MSVNGDSSSERSSSYTNSDSEDSDEACLKCFDGEIQPYAFERVDQGRRNWGGRRGSCPPCLLLGGARGAKVPFKYKEYYINSFRGALS